MYKNFTSEQAALILGVMGSQFNTLERQALLAAIDSAIAMVHHPEYQNPNTVPAPEPVPVPDLEDSSNKGKPAKPNPNKPVK